MNGHIDESAELYALGALDESERAGIEQHVSVCETCAVRLEEASVFVAGLAGGLYHAVPPASLEQRVMRSAGMRAPARHALHAPHWQILAAAAAAFIIALIPAWVAIDRTTLARTDDNRALARLASAPFNRATFVSPAGNRVMSAKVLYGPRGDWYYIVVMHPHADMRVAYVHDGKMEMLGSVSMHGESGTLYLPINHRMDELALLQGATVVADAHLVY